MKAVCEKHQIAFELDDGCVYCKPEPEEPDIKRVWCDGIAIDVPRPADDDEDELEQLDLPLSDEISDLDVSMYLWPIIT